jgi:hypothetical protein
MAIATYACWRAGWSKRRSKAASVMMGIPQDRAFAALPLRELGSLATNTFVILVTPPGCRPSVRARLPSPSVLGPCHP